MAIQAQGSTPISHWALAERSNLRDVRLLDKEAQKKGFKPGTVLGIYLNARERRDYQLKTALEETARNEIELKKPGAEKKQKLTTRFVAQNEKENRYHLSVGTLGAGHNHTVFLAITHNQGPLAVSVPKQEGEFDSRPQEVAYHEALTGASHVIPLRGCVVKKGFCYYDRAQGDFKTLPDTIDNAPQLIRGLLRGGVQMAAASVMHLDLKFDNILIGMDGEPKFADFELASFVDDKGIVEESIAGKFYVMGNLLHSSWEKYLYSEKKLLSAFEHCPAEFDAADFKIGLQDNVWGQMILIGNLAKKSTTPWCQLSPRFAGRFNAYMKLHAIAHQKGLQADALIKELNGKEEPGKDWTFPYLRAFYKHMIEGLKKCQGNLFNGLVPQTPLDDLLKRMASLRPDQRITIQEAAELFELAESNPTGYFEAVEKLYPQPIPASQSTSCLSRSPTSSDSDNDTLAQSPKS